MPNPNIEELTKTVEELKKENETLKAELKVRTDEVGNANTKLEQLTKQHEALKEQAGIVDAEQPGEVKIKVKDAKSGDVEEEKVTIAIPFVRVEGATVSSVAFMKVAAGKSLSEKEQQENPILDTLSKDTVLRMLTKWASMKVGFLKYAEKPKKKSA